MPLKGEVWNVRLDPVDSSEQAKTRPCVVISNDRMNTKLPLSIVVPFTGTPHYAKSGALSPALVEVLPPEGGASKPSYTMAFQVRTVSHSRFEKLCGRVNPKTLSEIVNSVQQIIAY